MVERPKSELERMGELLAVIHGDGGHYAEEHGIEKATEDAIAKWHGLVKERDHWRGQADEALQLAKVFNPDNGGLADIAGAEMTRRMKVEAALSTLRKAGEAVIEAYRSVPVGPVFDAYYGLRNALAAIEDDKPTEATDG